MIGGMPPDSFWIRAWLAITPSVTRGRAKMQKTVTPSPTRTTDCETDGHYMAITVALRCGESVDNWPFGAVYQLATLHFRPATHTPN